MDHFNQGLDGSTALFVRSVVAGLVLIVRRDNVLYVTYQPVVRGRGIATVRRQPATGILEIVGAAVDFFEVSTLRLVRVGDHVPATYTHGNPVDFVDDFVPLPGDQSIVYLIGEGAVRTRTGISFSGGAIRIRREGTKGRDCSEASRARKRHFLTENHRFLGGNKKISRACWHF